ncbi:MAG: OsmC family protein [Cytophagales bacterium]
MVQVNGVVVLDYVDKAVGNMVEHTNGSGEFTEVMLKPMVKVADQSMVEKAIHLHHDAAKMCFIARSVNFPILHEPSVIV